MTNPIERLEALTGPDREVDLELWWACKANNSSGLPMDPDYKAHNLKMNDAPAYTASIDAALTLVPQGWSFALFGKREVIDCELFLRNTNTVVSVHDAVSEPIALCIAALKAKVTK